MTDTAIIRPQAPIDSPVVLARSNWRRCFEYWWRKYWRTWRGSLSYSIVFPTLYLAAMGEGLGSLVNRHLTTGSSALGTTSYLAFVAPGILSGSAMQIAVNESTYPVMGAIRWNRTYLAQLFTPVRVIDVLLGHLAFIGARLFMTCAIFCIVMAGFGSIHSGEGVLAVPVAVLTGMAFSLPVVAYSATQDTDAGISSINRLVVVPLFLFSGSFFPTHQLPVVLRTLALLTPLYHGVALCRSCTLGHLLQWSSLGHLGYLLGLCAVGIVLARRSYVKRLVT